MLNADDRTLIASLSEIADFQRKTGSAWSYSGDAGRTAAHGLIQYPAMMVPAMQRDILASMVRAAPKARTVLDPFVGSGTALTETLAASRSFVGYDINPLAILIAKVKASPLHAGMYAAAAEQVLAWIAADTRSDYAVSFVNQGKWFRRSNSIGLSRIRRAIEKLDSKQCRRFMWVALAETIRRCSNSRTSTFKLHIRPSEDLERLDAVAVPIFTSVLKANVERMIAEKARLKKLGVLVNGKMTSTATIKLQSISKPGLDRSDSIDLVLTSPPYGDNRTTVPYGQFSYLALRWIPHADIDSSIDETLLDSTHSLDTASMGGGLRLDNAVIEGLSEKSASFSRMYRQLQGIDKQAAKRWTAYCRDLSRSLENILKTVNSGGYLAWTVGQRRIRSTDAPLVAVLGELHDYYGAYEVTQLKRVIPSKRMPTHNSIGSLMQIEHVCFYRKRLAS
ncbi:hypothetical protein IVA98_00305 [Bradyrhizobium sp. 160]|uniref:DNA methyltransferase n=1 Tax=Bradyrhizobium sp. 160 TaxID=2782634 RepID=UPI001FFA629F|nr:DNA methyltransferase [Bradyrhizobium sp. 160]MCK1621729.1 hypothetical protein [Bradyrhizobium sp. 160]